MHGAIIFVEIDLLNYATYNKEQRADISRKVINAFTSFDEIMLVSDIEVSVLELYVIEILRKLIQVYTPIYSIFMSYRS